MRERVRAGKAEARCEDLRWREGEARSRTNRLKAILDRNWAKPDAALADIREVRRKAKRALALEREVMRPGRLLAAAGVDPRRRSPVVSPRRENAALKARVREPEDRAAALEARNEALHSSRSSKSTCGRKSGKKSRPSSDRKRGQPSGASGHGRTKRPKLEVKAPPPPRRFSGTAFGTGVWARGLHERFACLRPYHRVADWLTCQGLAVSPGTLADATGRMRPRFEPPREAILAHPYKAGLRHADETRWRIRALGEIRKSHRAWRWTSVRHDAVLFPVDRSRSAEAAAQRFSDTVPVLLVCDRHSACRKLARQLPAIVIPCPGWAHVRRDFLKCAQGRPRLAEWGDGWIDRIAGVCRLNAVRRGQPGPDRGSREGFEAAQAELEGAVAGRFAEAERQRVPLPEAAPEGKVPRSLIRHRDGIIGLPPPSRNPSTRSVRCPSGS